MPGQVWAVPATGGYMYSGQLSRTLRYAVQPLVKFRQFADVRDAAVQGKSKGETFNWNVYSDVATAGTTLVETNVLPQTNFVITQGTMTITEYGNSVPYTGKLDDLSLHPVREVIQQVLKNDAKKAFDSAAHAQFNATPLRVVPTGGNSTTALTLTVNGTATLTNNIAMQKEHVKLIMDLMKERNIPAYVNDDYVSIAHPTTFRRLKNDLEAIHLYVDQGFRMILNGEMGRYEGCRFIEQTNIGKGVTNNGVNWINGQSNWAYFFGQDTVAEGIVTPEEMRGKIPDDYGRGRGIAWYYIGGFGIVQTAAANARIVKWDSAA